eukprot:9902-Chlamydomonas_euryale.AAC.1
MASKQPHAWHPFIPVPRRARLWPAQGQWQLPDRLCCSRRPHQAVPKGEGVSAHRGRPWAADGRHMHCGH